MERSPHKVNTYCIYCIQNWLFLWVNLDQAHTRSLYYFTFINNKYKIVSIEYEVFFKNKKIWDAVIQKTLL